MSGPRKWTEELIAQRVREGRGQGDGAFYSPWLYVQEFSSKGTQTRIPSLKLGRTVHTFSYLERNLFLTIEFQAALLEYKEQFPLDRGITLGAAAALKIRHPRYHLTNVPAVMTLDALVKMEDFTGNTFWAGWDAKQDRFLKKRRVAERISLHRAYCNYIGIPHYIFTENSVSREVVRNIDWIRAALPKDGELHPIPAWQLDEMHYRLRCTHTRPSITHFCAEYDISHSLERGTGLRVFKLLIWSGRLTVNLKSPHIELQPIPCIADQPPKLQ